MRRMDGKHRWKFFRAGGVDQVLFRDGNDLARLEELDQKLWVALGVPTRGIEFDPRTADLLDTDKDGRIRPPELIAATRWIASVLQDLGVLMTPGDAVALSWIKDADLLAAARGILADLGKAEATEITLADVTATEKVFAARRFNGDGVVTVESAPDEATRKAIADIVAVLGGVADRSGTVGVDQARLDAFFAQVTAHEEWASKARDAVVEGLGVESSAIAAAAVSAVRAKVDDYFARCRLAAFDPRALGALNREEKEYLPVAAKDLSSTAQEVSFLPLARVEAGRPLPLTDGLNPAWAEAMGRFVAHAVEPLLGARTQLGEAEWLALKQKVAAHDAWSALKPSTVVEKLGAARLRELAQSTVRSDVAALIARDLGVEKDNAQIAAVEKLVRFRRDLYELITNFVNFADFYGRTGAIFQAGTLILDARACTLCIEVADPTKHAALAGLAGAYLAYCDLTRTGGKKKTVVALFTDGDSDNLMVGRNGIFYDRQGQDWDATITRIVANPISVREAFWTPYKKFVRMIEEQIAKRAATAQAETHTDAARVAEVTVHADKTPEAAKQPAKKFDVGTVAALGVALGSIGTFFGLLLGKFLDLGAWMPIGLLAIVGLVSGPSMLLAWLKLRNRNLGPILDASGWAINTKARMNVPFGAALTHVAALPVGAERLLRDPFAEKRRPGVAIAAAAIVLLGCGYALNHQGYIHRWTGGVVGTPRAAAVATTAAAASAPVSPPGVETAAK